MGTHKWFVLGAVLFVVLATLTILHSVIRTVQPQVIHYDIVEYGISSDGGSDALTQSLVADATAMAFALWKESNPGLVFKGGDGRMTIVFVPLPHFLDGLALCPFWSNSEDGCYILVSTYMLDRYRYPANKNQMANVLAHQTGHALGMMHAESNDHLMHGNVYGW